MELNFLQDQYNKHCQDAISRFQKLAEKVRNGSGSAVDLSIPTPSDPTVVPTRTIGPYSNCTHHYTGLFSTIYRCSSPSDSSSSLAVKVSSPAGEQPPHNSKREGRILSDLSHPNIIQLHASHTLRNRNEFLLTFPFIPSTLAERLRSSSPVPKSVLQNVFSALAYLRRKAILHRDVKPSNILLSGPSGPAVLTDFGIAWSPKDPASEPAEEKITDIGTTCYRAPELLFGCRNYGTAVDLWAAGCVAAEIFYHNSHCSNPKMEEWTLFVAGELGSELALIKSIFETLGTPDEETWPETEHLPDWGKMSFVCYPPKRWEDILPEVEEVQRDLIKKLVRYESAQRTDAAEVSSSSAWRIFDSLVYF